MTRPSTCITYVFFAFLFVATGLPHLLAQAELKALQTKNYDQLDQRYAQAVSEQVNILTPPRLEKFFEALELPYSAPDEKWIDRIHLIADWREARPDSKAAVLALADIYTHYGFKARGTSLAKDVPSGNWGQFYERLGQASHLLRDNEAALSSEVEFHYLLAWIHAPGGTPFKETLDHIAKLRELSPHYWPAYSLLTTYMLPRWGAELGDLQRYAAEAADTTGGIEGDMLYSRMMGQACYYDEARFPEFHHPNIERLNRGYDEIIRRTARDDRWRSYFQSEYAYAAGILGDWPRARRLLVMQYPVFFFSPWNGREQYDDQLTRSGARQELATITSLESQGKTDEAEARLLAIEPDRQLNFALTGFYLRHGRADDFFASPNSPDPLRPIASLSMNDTSEACRYYAALRLYDQARQAALRFDGARGHNITGKAVLYQIALASGDPVAIQHAKDAITGLKTNRASYQIAQTFLRSDSTELPRFNWSDGYVFQAATVIALNCYERGAVDQAHSLLSNAAGNCQDFNQRELLLSLLYHPPQQP